MMGVGLVFVIFCIVEAIKEYRFTRKMHWMEIQYMKDIQWRWPRKYKVQPLFWNGSRRRDE